ncbi:MAG: hypothetical protein ACP5IG_04875, partial [Candidatus Micrarchaeia archaeon]
EYYARFSVRVVNGSDKVVFFFRAGNESSAINSQAAIIKLSQENGETVFGKNLFSKFSASKSGRIESCQADAAAGAAYADGLYKWVEAEINSTAQPAESRVAISVPLLAIRHDTITNKKFRIYYRALAILNDSNVLSDPLDESIKASEAESTKRCAFNASEQSYVVEDMKDASFSCSDKACLTLSYSQRDESGKPSSGGERFIVRVPPQTEMTPADYLSVSFSLDYLFTPPLPEETTQDDAATVSFSKDIFQLSDYPGAIPILSGTNPTAVKYPLSPETEVGNVKGTFTLAPLSAQGGSTKIN